MFDPATIIDRATYDHPHALSVGVRDVLVNGTAVVRAGTLTNALPAAHSAHKSASLVALSNYEPGVLILEASTR